MSDIDPQQFGRLQAEVESLRRDMDQANSTLKEMSATMAEMNRILNEARGGWKTLLLVGGAAAAVSSAITKAAVWWATHKF